jgi:hypothetical protein
VLREVVAEQTASAACQAALDVLKSAAMHRVSNNRIGWVRVSMAGLMTGLMLVLVLLSASGSLHRAFHGDSQQDHGQCAVCSIHQGKLDAPDIAQPMAVVPVFVAWASPQSDSEFVCSFDYSSLPSNS